MGDREPARGGLRLRASVIIPTYNRACVLSRTLAQLALDESEQLLEVIVCDDGSADGTRDVAERFASRLPLAYLRQEDLGFRAAAARNMGIRRARGDVLIFLDDDCVPLPGFVSAHCAMHREPQARVGLGLRRRLTPREGAGPGDHAAGTEPDDRMRFLTSGSVTHPFPWKLLYSCNMSLRRDHDEAYFDERFQGWGMEDTELGFRLWLARTDFQVAHHAAVLHVDERFPRDPFRRELLGAEPDYLSYLVNCCRLLDKFPAETSLWSSLLPDLQWYSFDHALGRWKKDGRKHDPAEVLRAVAEVRLPGP
jgi:glycosyltransferase involved in cell wall biosynthesis